MTLLEQILKRLEGRRDMNLRSAQLSDDLDRVRARARAAAYETAMGDVAYAFAEWEKELAKISPK